jgi:hypothetical protein
MNALQALLSALFLAASSIAAAVASTPGAAARLHPESSNPLAAEASAFAQVWIKCGIIMVIC